ncbi:MAG: hypothetical protein K0Q92_3088 [Steroidobacteraceae bacterium]|nr:hypothetical protein [Steroidobacteraceae bacterium]
MTPVSHSDFAGLAGFDISHSKPKLNDSNASSANR